MSEEKKIKKILRVAKEDYSSLSAFVERPVPTEKEVSSFESAIKREARSQEIDTHLSEIYTDKKGNLVDVKKMKIRRRQLAIIRFFKKLLIFTLLIGAGYFAYIYFFDRTGDVNSLEINISAPEKAIVGEEISYSIDYHNPSKFILKDVHLEIQYPENFIVIEKSIEPDSGNYGWNLPNLEPGASAKLNITGKLIGKPDSVNIITARLSYLPSEYSSKFKKEASASTVISGLGWRTDLVYSNTAFLNQDNELILNFSDVENNYIGDFNLTFSLPEETNVSIVSDSSSKAGSLTEAAIISTATSTKAFTVSKAGGVSWQISGLSQESGHQEIPVSYKINTKILKPEIIVRLEKKLEDGQSYIFWEKAFQPELVKSDLNLEISVNGSNANSAVGFGQTLDYSISYNNKGEGAFKDVIIMAVLQSDFLNFGSLKMKNKGNLNGQSITWTKNEIPALEEIKPGQEGEINFSIDLKAFNDDDLGKELNVNSYAQYSVNNQAVKNADNKSNEVISLINSDLSLSERILYFNEDNMPVGSGPLPPRVGEKTSFKVYWVVKNNLHELSDTKVTFNLPVNINFDEKSYTNVGSLYYNANARQVIWEIGRLPVSVYRADAEFGISVIPSGSDRDKILVLSPGSEIEAVDTETNSTIIKKTSAKTTKLEDDDIVNLNNSSGRVE